jgi:hypothetical protein
MQVTPRAASSDSSCTSSIAWTLRHFIHCGVLPFPSSLVCWHDLSSRRSTLVQLGPHRLPSAQDRQCHGPMPLPPIPRGKYHTWWWWWWWWWWRHGRCREGRLQRLRVKPPTWRDGQGQALFAVKMKRDGQGQALLAVKMKRDGQGQALLAVKMKPCGTRRGFSLCTSRMVSVQTRPHRLDARP